MASLCKTQTDTKLKKYLESKTPKERESWFFGFFSKADRELYPGEVHDDGIERTGRKVHYICSFATDFIQTLTFLFGEPRIVCLFHDDEVTKQRMERIFKLTFNTEIKAQLNTLEELWRVKKVDSLSPLEVQIAIAEEEHERIDADYSATIGTFLAMELPGLATEWLFEIPEGSLYRRINLICQDFCCFPKTITCCLEHKEIAGLFFDRKRIVTVEQILRRQYNPDSWPKFEGGQKALVRKKREVRRRLLLNLSL